MVCVRSSCLRVCLRWSVVAAAAWRPTTARTTSVLCPAVNSRSAYSTCSSPGDRCLLLRERVLRPPPRRRRRAFGAGRSRGRHERLFLLRAVQPGRLGQASGFLASKPSTRRSSSDVRLVGHRIVPLAGTGLGVYSGRAVRRAAACRRSGNGALEQLALGRRSSRRPSGSGPASWNFPGLIGKRCTTCRVKPRLCVSPTAACRRMRLHLLHRVVEIDRTYYEALAAAFFLRAQAQEVPDDSRFLVKAHEECTVFRFPTHARCGGDEASSTGDFSTPPTPPTRWWAPWWRGWATRQGRCCFSSPAAARRRPVPRPIGRTTFCGGCRGAARLRGRAAQRRAVHARAWRRAARRRGAPLSQRLERDAAASCSRRGRSQQARAGRCWCAGFCAPGDNYEAAGERQQPFDRLREEDPENRSAIAKAGRQGARARRPGR